MRDVCDFSGVDRAGCVHCVTPSADTEREVPDPPTSSRTFPAQFDGTCRGCEFDIRIDQPVRYVADALVHAGCTGG